MINIDWGLLATIMVVSKGLWDIYKERHKPLLDLSSFDANIATAANVSVKSLLETIAQMQKRMDTLEASERRTKSDLQNMGRSMMALRGMRDRQSSIITQLNSVSSTLLKRLEVLEQSVAEEKSVLDRLQEEITHLGTGPL